MRAFLHPALGLAIVAIMTVPAFASAGPVPPLPIQDLTETLIDCPNILDNPVSGEDVQGLFIDGGESDLDQDKIPNSDELLARSDPTKTESTPDDHDGDGVAAGVDVPANGGCDFDPRIPAVLSLELSCQPVACTPPTSIARNQTLVFTVSITNVKLNQPASPDPGEKVLCDITHGGAPDADVPTIELAVNAQDKYVGNVLIGSGFVSGDWDIECHTKVNNVRYAAKQTISVKAITFQLLVDFDRLGYFEDEIIEVHAKPRGQEFFRPQDGSATASVVDPKGVPIVVGVDKDGKVRTLQNIPMDWDNTNQRWQVSIATDLLPDPAAVFGPEPARLLDKVEGLIFDGIWTIKVSAKDGAKGDKNTANSQGAVPTSSKPVDQIKLYTNQAPFANLQNTTSGLNAPVNDIAVNDFIDDSKLGPYNNQVIFRNHTLSWIVDHKHRDLSTVDCGAGPCRVTLKVIDAADVVVVDADMTPVAGTPGKYRFDLFIPMDAKSGDLKATATIRYPGVSVPSNTVITTVKPAALNILVRTDKPSYSAGGIGTPVPDTTSVIGAATSAASGIQGAGTGLANAATTAATAAASAVVEQNPGGVVAAGMDVLTAADGVSNAGVSGATAMTSAAGSGVISPALGAAQGPHGGELVEIMGFPQGVPDRDFISHGPLNANNAPGVATFTLFYGSLVDRPSHGNVEDPQPLEGKNKVGIPIPGAIDVPMFWTCPPSETCRFRGTYQLSTTSPPGTWHAVVNWQDEADRPNRGENSAAFSVNAPDTPAPPQVSIDQIQEDVAGLEPVSTDLEAWQVSGSYKFTHNNPALLDANEVWVRINRGAVPPWVRATLTPDPDANEHSGTWTVTLHSQYTYGADKTWTGTRDVQAVAVINLARNGPDSCVQNDACAAIGPNGDAGKSAYNQPVTGIYSSVATKQVAFTFPDSVVATMFGVKGPTGAVVGNGDVLWNDTTHVLSGRLVLAGNVLSRAVMNIERVAFDNCAPLIDNGDPDDTSEWCLRDRVTQYREPGTGKGVLGYDFYHKPAWLPSRVSVNNVSDQTYFNFTWDIRDSPLTTTVLNPCNGDPQAGSRGTYWVEDNQTLVRRTNNQHNGSGAFPAKIPGGGGPNCNANTIPEFIEDQPWLKGWEKTNSTRKSDYQPFNDQGRYWVWMTVRTSKGFYFNQSVPKTSDEVRIACLPKACASARANTQDPSQTDLNKFTDGRIPKGALNLNQFYDAIQLRFRAYPTFTINTLASRTQKADGSPGSWVTGLLGQTGFRLRSADGPYYINGTINGNGNPLDLSGLKLVLYQVEIQNCVSDTANSNEEPPESLMPLDDDGEWCVVADDSENVLAFNLRQPDGSGFNYNATAGPQTYSVLWTPSKSATGIWWATLSIKTKDGDRVEKAPPAADPRGAAGYVSGAPSGTISPTVFNFLLGLEILCKPFCDVKAPPNPPYIPGQNGTTPPTARPGLFGSGYPAAVLFEETPTLTLKNVGPMRQTRILDPYNPTAAPCHFESDSSATGICTTYTQNKKTISGDVSGNFLYVNGTASDFEFLNDLKEVTIDLNHQIFNATGPVAKCCGAGATYHRLVDLSHNQGGSELTVTRTLQGVDGVDYLKSVSWSLKINASGFRETVGPTAAMMRKTTAAQGGLAMTRDFAREQLIVNLTTVTGTKSSMTALLGVDRVTAPDTQLLGANDPVTNATLPSIQAYGPQHTLIPNRFNLTGDAQLRFITRDAAGVSFGSGFAGQVKLSRIDISDAILGPSLDWSLTGSPADKAMKDLGIPRQATLDRNTPVVGPIIFPMKVCSKGASLGDGPPVAAPDDCAYNGDPTKDPTNANGGNVQGFTGTQWDGLTFFLFLPVRVGVDPPFVKIKATDPWDPTTWTVQQGDGTFGVDFESRGPLVDYLGGQGYMADNAEPYNDDNWTGFRFFNAGVNGNLDPEHLEVDQSIIPKWRSASGGRCGPDSDRPTPNENANACNQNTATYGNFIPWTAVGLDESCGSWVLNPDADKPESCAHPFLPVTPATNETGERADNDTVARTYHDCKAAGPDADKLSKCLMQVLWDVNTLVANCTSAEGTAGWAKVNGCFRPTDDWGNCFLNGNMVSNNDRAKSNMKCDVVQSYKDETLRESVALVNKNLPLWVQLNSKTYETNTAEGQPSLGWAIPDQGCTDMDKNDKTTDDCAGSDYQPPQDDDTPERRSGNFSLPRGFIWNDAITSSGDLRKETIAADSVTYHLTKFNKVFVTVNEADPDYGKIALKDGTYIISIKGVDYTESFTTLDPDLPGIKNDVARSKDFVFSLKTDTDGDGISDIRERWLQKKIQNGTMCQKLALANCLGDRYFDPKSPYPDPNNGDSTEQDLDGDGISNFIPISPITIPATDNTPEKTITPPIQSVDLETRLNMDPLVPDFPGTPFATCKGRAGPAVGDAVSHGSGPSGDRDNDCVPNLLDDQKEIHRCKDAAGAVHDADKDTYCDRDEDLNGDGVVQMNDGESDPHDENSTPTDKNGDGIADQDADLVNSLLPKGTCLTGQQSCGGHFASVDVKQGGIEHVYIDLDMDRQTFSVGFHQTDAAKPCPVTGTPAQHCVIAGSSTLVDAAQIVADLVNGRLCIAGAPEPFNLPCADGHDVTIIVEAGGVGYLYADRDDGSGIVSVGFSYTGTAPPGCNDVGNKNCQLFGTDTINDAIAALVKFANDNACVQGASAVFGPCADGHLLVVNVNAGGIKHLYVDQTGTTFSVGYHRDPAGQAPCAMPADKPDHCELIGTDSLGEAITMVAGLVNGNVCIAGAPQPFNLPCPDGHAVVLYVKKQVGTTTIEHIYADKAATGTGFSIGFHFTGDKPAYCAKLVKPQHCELVGDSTLALLLDLDQDGAQNVAELQADTNPFYKYSYPDLPGKPAQKGQGFLVDWDADWQRNADELGGNPKSNPFQRCSTSVNPRGWSPTTPTADCEDTNPIGGFNDPQ